MPGLPWWNSLEAVVPVADIGGQVSQLVGDEMDGPALALDVDRAGAGMMRRCRSDRSTTALHFTPGIVS
jgi:hypothetical protein